MTYLTPTLLRRTCVAGILVLAALLYFQRINAPSMWLDEIYHRQIGFQSVHDIVHAEFFMQFCVGYYLINRWTEMVLSDPAMAVRVPQALAALLTVLFAYLTGRRLYSTGAGLLAALALLCNPVIVRYAQENRFYAMGALGALAVVYYFMQFLETRRGYHLAGLVGSAALLLYTYTYGFVFLAMLAPLLVLVWLGSLAAGRAATPYRVDWRVLGWLTLAGACVALLWMPAPIRIAQWLLSGDVIGASGAKQGHATFDSWWREPFRLHLQALLVFVRNDFLGQTLIGRLTTPWTLLLGVGVLGSLVFGRGRALTLIVYYMLVTVALIHVSNMAQSVVMAKRFLYVYPAVVIVATGGCATLVEACVRAAHVLAQGWLRAQRLRYLTGMVRALAWLTLIRWLVLPVLGEGAYNLAQYYYEERAAYKITGRILARHFNPGDTLWWSPFWNDGWLIAAYAPERVVTARVDKEPSAVRRADLEAALTNRGRVWLHQINPAAYGYAATNFITLPMAGHATYILAQEYLTNNAARTRDEIALLREVLSTAACPEVACAERLGNLLWQAGRTNEADAVITALQSFAGAEAVRALTVDYFQRRADAARVLACQTGYANRYWWRAEPQYAAATAALEADAWAIATRYARRLRWLTRGRDARADALAAVAATAAGDTAHAAALWARAEAAAATDPPAQALLEQGRALLLTRDAGALVGAVLHWWTNTYAMSELPRVDPLLRRAFSTPRAQASIRAAALSPATTAACAALIQVVAAPTPAALTNGMCAMRAAATAETWPLYCYAMQTYAGAPAPLWLVSWTNLVQRGFPAPAQMRDGMLVWFEAFYRRYLPPSALAAFYAWVGDQDAHRAWWASTRSAQWLLRHGATTTAVRHLERDMPALLGSSRGAPHAAAMLAGAQTPQALAVAADLTASLLRQGVTTATLARLRAVQAAWTRDYALVDLPAYVAAVQAALTNPIAQRACAYDPQLSQAFLAQWQQICAAADAPPRSRTRRALLHTLHTNVAWETLPLYLAVVDLLAAPAWRPGLQLSCEELVAAGMPAISTLGDGTLLWLETYFQAQPSEKPRAAFYACVAGNDTQRAWWAALRQAAQALHAGRTNAAVAALAQAQAQVAASPRGRAHALALLQPISTTDAAALRRALVSQP